MFGYDNLTAQQLAAIVVGSGKRMDQIFTDILKPYHLTLQEWRLLGLICIESDKGLPTTIAMQKLNILPPAVTRLSNALVAKKLILVKPYPEDTRRRNLVIRSRGRNVIDESEERIEAYFHGLLLNIANSQLRGYIDTALGLADMSKTPGSQESNQ